MLGCRRMKQVAATTNRRQRVRHRRAAVHRRGALRLRWRQACRAEPFDTDRSTLLQLVHEVQKRVRNDADVVRIVRWLVNSGAVMLTGTFAGRHF
jgi:hypothetical protein